jgi:DNA repair protein RecO (recombination protein O)
MEHTEALILFKEGWREADLLVTLFTRDFGKIRALAQGARKHGAKLQGHLEPGTMAYVSIVTGRAGYRLVGSRSISQYPRIGESLSKVRLREAVLEVLNRSLFEERGGDESFFLTTKEFFEALEEARRVSTLRHLAMWFDIRFFSFLGVLPDFDSHEAASSKMALELARKRPEEIDGGFDEEELHREFATLVRRLRRSIDIPTTVRAMGLAI